MLDDTGTASTVRTPARSRRLPRTGLVGLLGLFGAAAVTFGQSDTWYPSRWGADDQRGAANRLTPAKVLEARNLITQGTVYQLGRVYEPGMPMFGTRHYSLRIPYPFRPAGRNQMIYHDEIISGELGQIGTQFDGLGHIGIDDRFYNGNRRTDFATAEGLTRLGVEHAGPMVTRGVLIDVAGYKGVARLDGGYEITVADLTGALARQGTTVRPGDVVVLHTGWGSLWMQDNARFAATEPGLGLDAGQWLVDAGITMAGADTWGVEVVPNPDAALAFPVHQLLLPRNGIYILENLVTEELARDNAYEFAFVFAPLRLKGATGSPGNPIAIR
jgi:kynurenine formamidase